MSPWSASGKTKPLDLMDSITSERNIEGAEDCNGMVAMSSLRRRYLALSFMDRYKLVSVYSWA